MEYVKQMIQNQIEEHKSHMKDLDSQIDHHKDRLLEKEEERKDLSDKIYEMEMSLKFMRGGKKWEKVSHFIYQLGLSAHNSNNCAGGMREAIDALIIKAKEMTTLQE